MAKTSKGTTIVIQGDLDIFSIHAQSEFLRVQLATPGPHVLDLRKVGDIDLSGFQLLISAAVSVQSAHGSLVFEGVSPALSQRLEELGFHSLLGEAGS